MAWEHLSITKPHLVYIILGGFTSLFMLCSSVIKERMYIGEATVATLCGVIFGPHAANLIDPAAWGGVDIMTIEFSRIVLVVQCFAVGVELPKYYMEKHWRSVTFLLVPVMTFGWLITSLFVWWLVEPLNFLESLVVAACVTATDPVLASSVVGKGKFAKRVPKHLRDLLSAESGCNDGMAFPFIYLSLYLIQDRQSAREVSFHWVVYTVLYECIFGAIYGFIIGYLARHGIKYAEKHELIDRESFLVFYFVLALFCAGSGSILGLDDLLVGFSAGVGFSNDGWFTQKTEESHVSNVIDLLLNLTYFVYFGTVIPWESFNDYALGLQAWRLAVLAIFVILFRRIPIMMLLKPVIPDIKTWREALFAGHFGPIGVGAIFVAMLARGELESQNPVPLGQLPPPGSEHYTLVALVWPIVSFIVVSSIIVHGSSIAVFTLGKHINTLTITMSYTQATEEGPSWINRLPRISSQSRSQARTMSDTEVEELKMPDLPPGTLPPVGLPGNFLRRVRDEEDGGSRQGSRSSSLAPRRRKKKWDDGLGPGGPISQSAIFPQRRNTPEPLAPGPPRVSSELPRQDSGPRSPTEEITTPGFLKEPEPEGTALKSGTAAAVSSPTEDRRETVEIYDENDHVIVENQDGDVLAVRPSNPESFAEQAKVLASKLKAETGPSGWAYDALKKRIATWREGEIAKRKAKEKTQRKGEPARAYQFGNTIIVEDEDGEVVKKYDLPTEKPQTDLVSQGLKYMGMGVFAKAVDRSGAAAGPAAGGEGQAATAGEASAPRQRKKSVVAEQEAEDDKHLRFTIGGIGKRMNKEDFIREMQKLDKTTRGEAVGQSSASQRVKGPTTQDAAPPPQTQTQTGEPSGSQQQPRSTSTRDHRHTTAAAAAAAAAATAPKKTDDSEAASQRESSSRPPSSGSKASATTPETATPSDEAAETEVERRRRLAALKGVGGGGQGGGEEEEQDETAAERRRREAALGMLGSQAADDEEEDSETPSVPPSRRAIRFADAPERGRRA